MKFFKCLLMVILAVVLVQISFSQQRINGKVVEVSSGKTVVLELSDGKKITAELEYIEVPESEQPLSQAVKEHLKNLVFGKNVELVVKVVMPNRIIGKVFLGDVNISQQMLRDGAAWYAILEKDRQDAFESRNFQIVESQAKLEKRGVWGVEDLPPAWEFRAEKARIEKARKEAERTSAQTTLTTQYTAPKRRYMTPEEQNQGTTYAGLWAGVVGLNEKKYLGIDGLYSGTIPEKRITYIYTGGTMLDLTQNASEQKVEFRAFYGYQGDQVRVERDVFALGLYSESKDYKFAKSNALTIFVNGQRAFVGKPIRFQRQDNLGAQELMIYKISQSALEKLARANNVKIKLGVFSGEIKENSRVLVDKLLKTTN